MPIQFDPFPLGDLFSNLQAITDLNVHAGIDTCRVRFKTRQPTIPFVEATAPDGTTVATSFPLFGGLRTEHEMLLGANEPLPQATEIKLRIVAAGHNLLGQPREAIVNTRFKTGSRHVKIDFTEIKVHTDGDPGLNGAGDFRWVLGAGDADSGARMGEPWPIFERDADAGELIPLRKQINIAFAPRNLGVTAGGLDDDSSILFAPGLPIVGWPAVNHPGTGEVTAAELDYAWATQVFDIANAANGTVIPLELATGRFAVAFTVKGRITVTTTPGRSPINIFQPWKPVKITPFREVVPVDR